MSRRRPPSSQDAGDAPHEPNRAARRRRLCNVARRRRAYFRFLALRFVFFAVFFAAALAFLRFAIVPSNLEMALSNQVQSRIDLHCISITTESRKQRLHLTKRVFAPAMRGYTRCADASCK